MEVKSRTIASGLLLRFVPAFVLPVILGFVLVAVYYVRDTTKSAEAFIQLQAQEIVASLDRELDRSLLALTGHLETWPADVAADSAEGLVKIDRFLNRLSDIEPRFQLYAVEWGGKFRRLGDQEVYSERYIQNLEFTDLPQYGVETTGFLQVLENCLDIWFQVHIPDQLGQSIGVRMLLRMSDYYPKIQPFVKASPQTVVMLKSSVLGRGDRWLLSIESSPDARAKSLELNPTKALQYISAFGDEHLVALAKMRNFPAEIVYANVLDAAAGPRKKVLLAFLLFILGGSGLTAALLLQYGRRQSDFLKSAVKALTEIRGGSNTTSIAEISGDHESMQLAASMENLAQSLEESRSRSKILNRTMFELFSGSDSDGVIIKCIELISTQCEADTAWFEPFVSDHEFYRAGRKSDRGVYGWQWKNHRIVEISRDEIVVLQGKYPERNTAAYAIKFGYESIGTLKAFFKDGVRDATRLTLDSIVSVLERTLARHDAIRKEVLATTETEFAKTIQKSVAAGGTLKEKEQRISQYYRPSDRLGGDWFYIIENKTFDGCYMILGSVAGGGVSQGLLTSGVKGGLDVIGHLVRNSDADPFSSPAEIIPLLESIVRSMNKLADSSITCFVAHVDFSTGKLRVANQKHSQPIIVRCQGDQARVIALKEVGTTREVDGIEVVETTLEKADFFVGFSDGLAHAKGFKSEIFERFMTNAIERGGAYENATDLRDDLKDMYEYYTSGKKQNDDVCFMVLAMEEKIDAKKSA